MALTALSRHAHRVPPTPKLYLKTAPTLQKRPFTQTLLERPVQIYRSTATDPYLNLSIEHCLFQRSHPDSTVLFLYANRPCVVIGRNQNPWLEVNLHLLREGLPPSSSSPTSSSSSNTTSEATLSTPDVYPEDPSSQPEQQNASSTSKSTPIALVRRRSGGGAVFHDQGNINWSVICPPAKFDRDKHAAMVVRALARLGVGGGVRVNGRHDIVMDVSEGNGTETTTFKVSGSAYKLTRTRSLHHGTCLLSSEHLGSISRVLRSPAERFIKARGVESVRSRIRNVGVGSAEFVDAVVGEFAGMYGAGEWKGVTVGEKEAFEVEEVVKGMKELTVGCSSCSWTLGETCADEGLSSPLNGYLARRLTSPSRRTRLRRTRGNALNCRIGCHAA
jgi:lipoate-protein ligase A